MGVYKRGEVFYLRYRDGAGRKLRQATTAKTKGEAKTLLVQLEAKAERQRMGLEAAPVQNGASGTLWDLCSWWLAKKCPDPSKETEGFRLGKHVERSRLGAIPLAQVNADVLAAYLDEVEEDGAEPGSVNKLRTILRAVFSAAAKPPVRWTGVNPAEAIPVRAIVAQPYATLETEEVEPLLANVAAWWTGYFATGIYLGLRKGEISALPKGNVDMKRRVVLVSKSNENDTTKGGHFDHLPIPAALVPYFETALRTPGPWMFPNLKADPSGLTMLSEDANPEKICRTAQKRAGIVTGYEHSCRRCGHARRPRGGGDPVPSAHKPYSATFPDDVARRCPQCGMKLWAEGAPRFRRFHDLRHSTGTILVRLGVELHHVQKILRHANIATTQRYVHLMVEDLRKAINLVGGSTNEAQLTVLQGNGAQTKHTAAEVLKATGANK